MGMFDWVDFKTVCPVCGAEVRGFQSKDAACELDRIPFAAVQNFYTSCEECHEWIEYNLRLPTERPIDAYEMTHYSLRAEEKST